MSTFVLWLEWQGFYADDTIPEPQAVVRGRIVLDVNLAARCKGLAPGMTVQEARNVVPELLRTPWQEEAYLERQRAWLDLCLPFCGRIEPIDAHIAALDLKGHPRPNEIAERMTEALVRSVGLPLRAGAGPSKWIAALAAHRHDLGRAVGDPAEFLAPLNIECLTPLDEAHRERLAFLGYRTAGDVARLPLNVLRSQFGDSAWRILQAVRGTLADPVDPTYPPDAVRACLTFDGPPDTFQALDDGLARLAQELAEGLTVRSAVTKRVILTFGHEEGEPTARARTFSRPLATAYDLVGALRLMLVEPPPRPLERIEINLPDLIKAQRVQLDLDARRDEAEASLRACVNNVRNVFGDATIRRGSEIVLPRWQDVRRAYRDAYGWAWL